MLVALSLTFTLGVASGYCDETPSSHKHSVSVGSTSNGSVDGAKRLVDTKSARVMPARHKARCLNWGVARLIDAIHAAADRVAKEHEGSPALGVGNIGRARGGPIKDFSRSHNAGRDADLAFYLLDATGKAIAADDLVQLDDDLKSSDGLQLDVARTWTLVAALLEDQRIDVQWLFVSTAVKRALLDEGKRRSAPKATLARAAEALHQPSDAPPHDDHLHLRIRCARHEDRCR